jgi:hypothetical protein
MEAPHPKTGGATDRLENGALQLSHYDSFPPSNSIFALVASWKRRKGPAEKGPSIQFQTVKDEAARKQIDEQASSFFPPSPRGWSCPGSSFCLSI